GAWLSLVERTVRDREVGCSNHLAPTILRRKAARSSLPAAFCCYRPELRESGKLISCNASWRLVAADLIDLDTAVRDARIQVIHEEFRKILSRWVEFLVKGREFIDVAVI